MLKIMQRKFSYLFSLIILLAAIPFATSAQVNQECLGIETNNFKGFLERAACSGNISTNLATGENESIITLVGNVLNIAYSFLGIVFVTLLVYAGYLWLTARGNDSQVENAQKILRNSIIGIILVFAAFIISREVVDLLIKITNGANNN